MQDPDNRLPPIRLTFDNAVLTGEPVAQRVTVPATPAPPPAPLSFAGALQVGWYPVAPDSTVASARYRCHHMARGLAERDISSEFFTDHKAVIAAMPRLDAVIVIKRLDVNVLAVVAAARQHRRPAFLDITDDLLSERYSKNPGGVNAIYFAGVAPALAGITAPSAAMAERIAQRAAALGLEDLPIHVIPDVAETWDIHARTVEYLTTAHAQQQAARPSPGKVLSRLKKPQAQATGPGLGDLEQARAAFAPRRGRKQLVWFGNFGAPHSNFGIYSLVKVLPALAEVNRDIPLELVVISNNEPLFKALTDNSGIPARYVPWSQEVVYGALAHADLALVTTGDDEFSTTKSGNRVLQALAAGVPVMTTEASKLPEFSDVVMVGNYRENLRRCLSLSREARRRLYVEPAQQQLARYTPERLSGIWAGLLRRAVAAAVQQRSAAAGVRPLLFVIEPTDRARDWQATLANAIKAGVSCEILLSVDAAMDPGFRKLLLELGILPRFVRDPAEMYPAAVNGIAALVVSKARDTPIADRLTPWAEQIGTPLLRNGRFDAEHAAALGAVQAEPETPTAVTPGPYPERSESDGSSDWVFIVHPKARGWILDAICREIGSRQPDSWQVVYNPPRLPRAKHYFFSHYSLVGKYLKRQPDQMSAAKILVWYTHPRDETPESIRQHLAVFNGAVDKLVFACASNRDLWLSRGLHPERGIVVLGGADPGMFRGHRRDDGAIGLSSAFYERKNPDVLLELIKRMPHRRFELLGRGWNQYALFEEMLAAPNFSYRTAPYREYPAIYAGWDVFLSMSTLEGGPIPLLEAMMENAVPVASDTGFAPDLIRPGSNGFIFAPDAPAAEIAALIEQAFALDSDVRASVLAYDWDNFSRQIMESVR